MDVPKTGCLNTCTTILQPVQQPRKVKIMDNCFQAMLTERTVMDVHVFKVAVVVGTEGLSKKVWTFCQLANDHDTVGQAVLKNTLSRP